MYLIKITTTDDSTGQAKIDRFWTDSYFKDGIFICFDTFSKAGDKFTHRFNERDISQITEVPEDEEKFSRFIGLRKADSLKHKRSSGAVPASKSSFDPSDIKK